MRWSAPLEAKAFTEASRQHGLLTREQLKALGASDRTIARRSRAGLWERLFPGVFRLLPSSSSGWHQRLMGVCLWLGEDAVVSHAAAGALWNLDGIEEQAIEVSTTRRINGRAPSGVLIHRVSSLLREAVTTVEGIPVTQHWRTLMDLARTLPTDSVDAALDCALRRKKTSFKQLGRMLEKVQRRGLAGLRTFRALLAQRQGTGPKDSEAERLFYRNVIDAHGLPRPEHNFRVKDRQGKFVAKVDAAYPQYGIAIEIYSKAHHTAPEAVQNDARRQNELVMAGMTPLIFWWEDITAAPYRTAERIAEAITLKTGEEVLLRSD